MLPAHLPKWPKTWEAEMQFPKEQNALNVNGLKIEPNHFNFTQIATLLQGKIYKSIQFTYKNLQTVFKTK